MNYRFAKNVDANQPGIVRRLRQEQGFSVALDRDDILVGAGGLNFWYEIKNPAGLNRLQPSQKKLRAEWQGHYSVARSYEDVLADMAATRDKLDIQLRELGR